MHRTLRAVITIAAEPRRFSGSILVLGLLIVLSVGLSARQDVGLADNGDFVRSSHPFALAP